MQSMTGYASRAGSQSVERVRLDWEWDLRSVNGRGLDLRLRLPEGAGLIEKSLRDQLGQALARGNVTLSLRMRATQTGADVALDTHALDATLEAVKIIQSRAADLGVSVRAPSASDILSARGVQPASPDAAIIPPERLEVILSQDFAGLLADFVNSREQEGAALASVIRAQLDEIARLTAAARALLDTRSDALRAHFRKALAQMLDAGRADPDRAAQEMALLAVKADLSEELDRLEAHVAAGQALVERAGPVGRKLDFLTQEFNREANTLCSKAQHLEMTRIGLDLKVVIDQMREQVQNVE